ncbi:ABC1 kinase family protein [Sphingobacterium yanglingense]|uniref:Ubiquinone biosynthesis protein n=1 Tax=Sphingobacterium yanglingense TaxID=1437280 RepID=A0A4R6WNL5_9SPHI|nr:AarF/UbiB family protein [Sphingobacterium yanglingense]TDQ79711.1 ubiquinone biosynthesis protein [Sphingobacterium yanglingense]
MENPIARQKSKLMRAAKLISILGKHGFEDLKSKITNKDAATVSSATTADQPPLFYERIRKVIEELGPTYVKFGQTLSTREDLLPAALILELKKLQDNVAPEDIDIRSWLENELQLEDLSAVFQEIDEQPFASASIAQVYKATLSNGDLVILKVKRTGIREIVTSDLLLLKDIINLLIDYYPLVREINLPDIFEAFEKNIIEELSFQHELKNIQQFARNFSEEPRIKCMQAYPELSTDSVLCISRIQGFRITDSASIRSQQLDPEYIIDTGLDLYLTQVLEHGFFHADPHPGNILVTPSGQISFIDLGAMARLLPKDKEHLENFILYFINKDTDNLIRTIKRMSIRIHIKNEKVLERDIQAMFDMIAAQSLKELDVKAVFSRFSKILNQNDILMPDHIYLLVRGIVLLEGIGRSLLPDLNIIDKVKPYITKIMAKRLSPPYIIENILQSLQQLQGTLSAAPKSLIDLLHKVEQGELKFRIDSQELSGLQQQQRKDSSINRLLHIAGVLFLGGCLLSGVQQSTLLGIPWICWILFVFSLIFLILAGIRKMRIG